MTIKQKQWQLYYLGYYGGQIDGIWGAKSKAATASFQKDNGLDADGIFGPLTIAKSKEVITAIQKAITDGKLAIDGLAGRETKDATVQWQAEHDLTPDGIAGVKTRAKIQEVADDVGWWADIRYFVPKEFACKCGRYCDGYPAQMQRSVVELADRARAELKGVGFVSSGLRCPRHNANVGGVSNSRHLNGKAIDLRIEGKSAKQTLAWVQKQPEVRYAYAIDANYVHMDVE
jgi:hypothetical protein